VREWSWKIFTCSVRATITNWGFFSSTLSLLTRLYQDFIFQQKIGTLDSKWWILKVATIKTSYWIQNIDKNSVLTETKKFKCRNGRHHQNIFCGLDSPLCALPQLSFLTNDEGIFPHRGLTVLANSELITRQRYRLGFSIVK